MRTAGPPEGPLSYAVEIYLPGTVVKSTRLTWSGERPELDPALDDPWVEGEVLKLARVLKRTGKLRVTRWRDRP